jgi:hypothetical protein
MELSFTEIDNLDSVNNYVSDINQTKYWEQTPKKIDINQKKKKVSFDDILSHMNLVVNQNGVLQSMSPLQPQYQQPQYQQPQYQQPQYQQPQIEPLDPSVKHSYIFNKYFKDYKDANDKNIIEKKIPKTIEEYNQMVLEERIKRIQERNRISQIKSTKMFFTTHPNMHQNMAPNVIKASKNNLRSMKYN